MYMLRVKEGISKMLQMVALTEKNLPSKWYWLENESSRRLRGHERTGGASKVAC